MVGVFNMKYGLLSYEYGKNKNTMGGNLGDEIQSIAASCFLPRIDNFIDREALSDFASDEKVKVIMNGWYMHDTSKWIPSNSIEPLLVSMHFNSRKDVQEKFYGSL